MINISVDIQGLRRLTAAMGARGRRDIHAVASNALLVICRKYLRTESARRHASARRLGATPTGHLEKAASSMVATASETEGTLNISSPGFARVFRDIHIRPRSARALTLPLAKESYGKRVGELRREGWQIFRAPSQGIRNILLGKAPSGNAVKALYLLRASVTLPRDRTLLPSDNDLTHAVGTAIAERLRNAMRNAQ